MFENRLILLALAFHQYMATSHLGICEGFHPLHTSFSSQILSLLPFFPILRHLEDSRLPTTLSFLPPCEKAVSLKQIHQIFRIKLIKSKIRMYLYSCFPL